MPLPPAQAQHLRQVLKRLGTAFGPTVIPTAPGRALEALVMMRLARAAQEAKWTVKLMGSDGKQLPAGAIFEFPVSQAGITNPKVAGPSYVQIADGSRDELKYELHMSLRWVGRSDATHECDVSLLPFNVASDLRQHGGGHPRGLPIASFECKDKSKNGNLDEMRQTVARMFDLTLVTMPYKNYGCRIFESRNNVRWGKHRKRYRDFFSSGMLCVVRAGKFSTGANVLGRHYSVHRYGDVYTDPRSFTRMEIVFKDLLKWIDQV